MAPSVKSHGERISEVPISAVVQFYREVPEY